MCTENLMITEQFTENKTGDYDKNIIKNRLANCHRKGTANQTDWKHQGLHKMEEHDW